MRKTVVLCISSQHPVHILITTRIKDCAISKNKSCLLKVFISLLENTRNPCSYLVGERKTQICWIFMVSWLFRACGCEGGGQIESGQENSEDVEKGDGQYAPIAPPKHHTTVRGKNN